MNIIGYRSDFFYCKMPHYLISIIYELFIIKRSLPDMKLINLFIILFTLNACVPNYEPVDARNSNLTQGNVQMNVVEGKTNKSEILEVFGAPNITTRDASGVEIWTYQRAGQATQSSSKSGGWSVIFTGQSYSNSGFSSNSRMMTLIIKFNDADIVSDFSSRTSNF
jgi:outer membrane protein assembly factor BamE (lipoprotein component of BamABCDE complex)